VKEKYTEKNMARNMEMRETGVVKSSSLFRDVVR
jgi:hypothetical protein